MKTKANQQRLMEQIRRNVAAVKAMQRQYELHGVREMKEMEAELKRLARRLDRGLDPRELNKP
jgi:hypothetical protein